MAFLNTLKNVGKAYAKPFTLLGDIGKGAYDSYKEGKQLEKNYNNAVDDLNKTTAANTGEAGSAKAQMMANQGAQAAGNTAAQSASSAAKSVGMNAEAADAIGDNIGNAETQNAFNTEYNKAIQANQDEIAEKEDEILKYNPELSFPLNGKERVVIYRQKI